MYDNTILLVLVMSSVSFYPTLLPYLLIQTTYTNRFLLTFTWTLFIVSCQSPTFSKTGNLSMSSLFTFSCSWLHLLFPTLVCVSEEGHTSSPLHVVHWTRCPILFSWSNLSFNSLHSLFFHMSCPGESIYFLLLHYTLSIGRAVQFFFPDLTNLSFNSLHSLLCYLLLL